MFLTHVIAAAAAIAAPAFAMTSFVAAPISAGSVEQKIIGGAWTGKFLQRDWTFEFRNEDGKLQGRYIRSDGRTWLPLNDILLSERSVAFSIESKPKVSFALEIARGDQDLAGTATVDGVATVPFSATRVP
ncbi:MAG TPA: hypothetical protein VEZ70_03365 [Allosphingosinicella sp.]|nr:hypothetical protein [Allosphingosinicella sp.]